MERDRGSVGELLQTYIRKREHEASKDEPRPQLDTNCVGHGVSIRLQAAKKVGGRPMALDDGEGRREHCTP